MTDYHLPITPRLEPRTNEFKGGRIADTDVLTLGEAATFASRHSGEEITSGDFMRSAARGEIRLMAIVHRTAKLKKYDGGIYCNQGTQNENTIPEGAILNLPVSACKQLAGAGRADWRTLDGFEQIDGELARFTVATLIDGEPDFETVPDDCRVKGGDVRALADAYLNTTDAPSGAPESDSRQEKQAASGVDRNKILAHFTPPNGTTAANWSKTLSAPPKWLIGARVFKGRASVSALWNPAMFAMAYAEKGIMTKLKLTEIIRREFAPWLPEWEKYTSSFD